MRRSRLLWTIAAIAVLAVSALGPLGAGDASAAPKGSPWGADYFPNVPLVTHDGKTVRFYDDLIKDKKVLVNFIYTSCQKACPLATAKLVQVQKRLGPRIGRDIFMYSITLDPEHDTPEVLKAYAAKFGVGSGWLFLTGKRQDIDAVRVKFGQRSEKDDHNNNAMVGDVATGQWLKLPIAADPDFLYNEIGKQLYANWDDVEPVKSYAEAPQREISMEERMLLPGQLLFRNRCATCHTLGKGDRIGPDLKGVTTRRDRAWLGSFLFAPDQMRARKDPIAVELSAKYPGVPMPNVGLTRDEVMELIDYLEAETNALEKKPPAQPVPSP